MFTDENMVPCHNVQNPFDFEYWENLPGFNDHHHKRTGTYVEDCGGAGGNICFAINGAIDPAPGTLDVFNLFDLVAHEFGHCLTLGHVGDGAEGAWGVRADQRHHVVQRRSARPQQVRVDPRPRGLRHPHEPATST